MEGLHACFQVLIKAIHLGDMISSTGQDASGAPTTQINDSLGISKEATR